MQEFVFGQKEKSLPLFRPSWTEKFSQKRCCSREVFAVLEPVNVADNFFSAKQILFYCYSHKRYYIFCNYRVLKLFDSLGIWELLDTFESLVRLIEITQKLQFR